ncbi:hypothetical protein [Sinorhizobium fredii]|uniref:hypothetical protein n=1 Tax=Rhizobium fredii TaxID=380 RepID=UPI0035150A15
MFSANRVELRFVDMHRCVLYMFRNDHERPASDTSALNATVNPGVSSFIGFGVIMAFENRFQGTFPKLAQTVQIFCRRRLVDGVTSAFERGAEA